MDGEDPVPAAFSPPVPAFEHDSQPTTMSLRIAFDCDGCVADLEAALEQMATRLFGEMPAASEAEPGIDPSRAGDEGPTADEVQAAPARFRALSRGQQHDLWEAVRQTENFWETLQETEPGVVERLARAASERRWEVLFITQRPANAGATAQLQTQRWLAAHGYDLPSVYVVKGTRGKVADALSLDVVVDDRPENCLDVKLESRARAILVWRGDPEAIPPNARQLGIEPVNGMGACLDLLTASPPSPKGLLSRLRKLAGA